MSDEMSREELFAAAVQVVELIAPLGGLEQTAVLELANTLRSYTRIIRDRQKALSSQLSPSAGPAPDP